MAADTVGLLISFNAWVVRAECCVAAAAGSTGMASVARVGAAFDAEDATDPRARRARPPAGDVPVAVAFAPRAGRAAVLADALASSPPNASSLPLLALALAAIADALSWEPPPSS